MKTIYEETASPAAVKEIRMDVAVAAVLSELDSGDAQVMFL